ncbi:MAG: 4Fe-4S binding protein [Nitrospirae bacterium]|nr:4Fe-4S binding protein [Nitrospirota bacterium]
MKTIRITLLAVTIVSFSIGFNLFRETRVDEGKYLSDVAPDAVFSSKAGTPPHYKSDREIIAFNSYDIVPAVRGYAGPIKVLLSLNSKGEITGIRLLEHKETPNYVHYLLSADYLSRFAGKNVNDAFEPDNDIDAVSRATVSLNALADTIRTSSRMIASEVYGLEVKGGAPGSDDGRGWITYLALFFAAFASYHVTRRSKRFLQARDILLLFGIGIIGVYLVTPFSIIHVFNLIFLRISSSYLWYAVIISTLLSVVIAGRFYCGWLCPFGALAEYIGKVPLKKWELSTETDDRWRKLKYIILGVVTALVLISRRPEYGSFETYVTLFSRHGDYLTWTLVGLMLIINVRSKRFWCRYLCPVAALTGIFSRRDDNYVSTKDCPMGNKPQPPISECIRCNNCYVKREV